MNAADGHALAFNLLNQSAQNTVIAERFHSDLGKKSRRSHIRHQILKRRPLDCADHNNFFNFFFRQFFKTGTRLPDTYPGMGNAVINQSLVGIAFNRNHKIVAFIFFAKINQVLRNSPAAGNNAQFFMHNRPALKFFFDNK